MKTFTLRVIPETENVVYRDIIVNSSNNFYELHHAILDSFEFTKDQMASFYESDEDWNRGQEISLFGMENGEVLEMAETPIDQVFDSVNQKMIYVYDFLAMWTFSIEVMEVGDAITGTSYPAMGRTFGDAPDQSSRDIDGSDAESILVNAMFDDGTGDYEALFDDEDDDNLFDDDRFESLDDYDEYN
ncbi:plasmid pRiA4b ORF-3 family protein [bacterium]|jgi:pRiA4b ORF-3-like protein|nr:plasmid pRiA4b ORF-3 family protein [bacterium]